MIVHLKQLWLWFIFLEEILPSGNSSLVDYADLHLALTLHNFFPLQYLEELIGSILFCWVACGVSIAALVEVSYLLDSYWILF